jgi:hypothetical protein
LAFAWKSNIFFQATWYSHRSELRIIARKFMLRSTLVWPRTNLDRSFHGMSTYELVSWGFHDVGMWFGSVSRNNKKVICVVLNLRWPSSNGIVVSVLITSACDMSRPQLNIEEVDHRHCPVYELSPLGLSTVAINYENV